MTSPGGAGGACDRLPSAVMDLSRVLGGAAGGLRRSVVTFAGLGSVQKTGPAESPRGPVFVVVDRVQLSPVQGAGGGGAAGGCVLGGFAPVVDRRTCAGGGGDAIRGAPVQLRAGRASKHAENPPGLPAGGGSGRGLCGRGGCPVGDNALDLVLRYHWQVV